MPKKVTEKLTEDSSSEDEEVQTKKTVTKSKDKKLVSKVKAKKEATPKEATPKDTNENDVVSDVESENSKTEQPVSVGSKQTGWKDLSDDDVNVPDSVGDNVAVVNETPQRRPVTRGRGAKYSNSVINFDYANYESVETPVNELNSRDLVKVLIVRAYNDGQHQLCTTLKQTLRAMNLECDFPTSKATQGSSSYQESKSFKYNKPGNFSSSKDSDRRDTHEQRDTRDTRDTREGYQGRGNTSRFGAGNRRPAFNKGDKDF